MALKTVTKLFGVDDAKLFPVTEDSETQFTCGEGIDLPGVRQISLTFEIDQKELTGDEKTLAVSSKIKSVTFNSEYAELSLDVLAALSGGSVSTSGSADTESATFSFSDGDLPKYFQLQAKINGTDSIVGGDCHIILYKCKASAIPINGVQNDFATYTFDGKGVFTEYKFGSTSPKAKLLDINFNAKAKELSAITSV